MHLCVRWKEGVGGFRGLFVPMFNLSLSLSPSLRYDAKTPAMLSYSGCLCPHVNRQGAVLVCVSSRLNAHPFHCFLGFPFLTV